MPQHGGVSLLSRGEVDDDFDGTVFSVAEQFKRSLYLRQGKSVSDDRRNVDPALLNPLHG